MSMDSILKRLEVLELDSHSDEPPTRCFFTTELFQAAANYGNQPPERVREDVQQVEDVIAHYDALRTEHQLDVTERRVLAKKRRAPVYALGHYDVGILVVTQLVEQLSRGRIDHEIDTSGRLSQNVDDVLHVVGVT